MEDIIKAIIVDDESEARDLLAALLEDYENISVTAQLSSVDEAIAFIATNPPDLVFLDIQMPKKNGFDLAIALRNLNIKTHIIFVTAYDQYAIQAVKHAAFDYLLKPINEEELRDTINRFQAKKPKTGIVDKIDDLLVVINDNFRKKRFNTRSGFIMLNYSDILYMDADGNYSKIFLTNGTQEIVTQSLGQMEEELPANNFFRINRSIIINTKYLARVNRRNRTCVISFGEKYIDFQIPLEQIKLLEALNY
jgi:two-component system LytT family response regulator